MYLTSNLLSSEEFATSCSEEAPATHDPCNIPAIDDGGLFQQYICALQSELIRQSCSAKSN